MPNIHQSQAQKEKINGYSQNPKKQRGGTIQ